MEAGDLTSGSSFESTISLDTSTGGPGREEQRLQFQRPNLSLTVNPV